MQLRRLLICVVACLSLFTKAWAVQYAYQITFTNKLGSSGAITPPLNYLSQRAIDRRQAFSIAIDSTDWPVSSAYLDSVLTLTGGKLHETSRWLNFCVILVNDPNQVTPLQGKSYISSVKQVGYYTTQLHRQVNTGNQPAYKAHYLELLNKTTGTAAYYGNTFPQTIMVHGDYLHDLNFKGYGKLISVIDAGFDGADTHPGFDSLRENNRILDHFNFTLDTDYVYSYDSHGTSTLSTMAGNVPGTFVGSAPMASYALYVSEDDNTEQPIELLNMVAAAERADSLGTDVISVSLGYDIFDNPNYNFNFATDFDGKTTPAAIAANMATAKGILFVASAGNEGGSPWMQILTPGDADSALTVGSVDATGTPATSSGYGPNAAGQIKPDVCDLGEGAAVFTSNGYGYDNGTSFSTPEIAGWVACLWQADPTATPGQIHAAINRSANYYSNPTNHIGYGIPNFENATHLLNINDTPFTQSAGWVAVAPNPVASSLNLLVSLEKDENVNFRVIDISGRTVLTASHYFYWGYNPAYSINVSSLPKGMYFVKAVSATRQAVVKVEKL
jgi:hypothetical protein